MPDKKINAADGCMIVLGVRHLAGLVNEGRITDWTNPAVTRKIDHWRQERGCLSRNAHLVEHVRRRQAKLLEIVGLAHGRSGLLRSVSRPATRAARAMWL